MQVILILDFELQNIILIVQHRKMDILLDTLFIRIIRQLLPRSISRDDSIGTGNNREVHDSSVIAQNLERVTRL